ncbi:MAG: hypothetical protein GY745_05695 [Actinomycetia bacterium]|nr:hypothetical protein [Actinomycetes bacterium]
MTEQLRPGVIVLALLALIAGVLGVRTLASSQSDNAPVGQPFVIEADYPATDPAAQETTEVLWTRPTQPRNPFVVTSSSPLAQATPREGGEYTVVPDEAEVPEGGATGDQPAGDAPAEAADEPATQLSNSAPAPTPGEVLDIEINDEDPGGIGDDIPLGE